MIGDGCELGLLWWSFTLCTNIESLRCTPETNTMLYVHYTSVKNVFAAKLFSRSFPPQTGYILREHFKLLFYGWCFEFITSHFFFVIMMIFNLHFHFKQLCSCSEPRKLIGSLTVPQPSVTLLYWDAKRGTLCCFTSKLWLQCPRILSVILISYLITLANVT